MISTIFFETKCYQRKYLKLNDINDIFEIKRYQLKILKLNTINKNFKAK